MQQFKLLTQIDIIDYMLSQPGEVPMLDRSLHSTRLDSAEWHEEGVDEPYDYIQPDELDVIEMQAEKADHYMM